LLRLQIQCVGRNFTHKHEAGTRIMASHFVKQNFTF